jgi:hypothetical protein
MWSISEGTEWSLPSSPTRSTSKRGMSLTNKENSWPIEIKFYSRKSAPKQGPTYRNSSRKLLPSYPKSTSPPLGRKMLIILLHPFQVRSKARARPTI